MARKQNALDRDRALARSNYNDVIKILREKNGGTYEALRELMDKVNQLVEMNLHLGRPEYVERMCRNLTQDLEVSQSRGDILKALGQAASSRNACFD